MKTNLFTQRMKIRKVCNIARARPFYELAVGAGEETFAWTGIGEAA
jgi:hypothetical protein